MDRRVRRRAAASAAAARAGPPGRLDAAGRRADRDVEEDRRAAARHDRARVVLDHREVAVLRRDPPERLAAAAERRPRAARDVPERVVRRRARVLVPPVAADEPVVAERARRDSARSRRSSRRSGTSRSASRRRPRACASRARCGRAARVHGPATRRQQPPRRSPEAERPPSSCRAAPATVTSCVEPCGAASEQAGGGEEGGYAHAPHGCGPRHAAAVRGARRARDGRATCRTPGIRGCPVGPAQLRRVRLRYVGFDGSAHIGAARSSTRASSSDVVAVFRTLYRRALPDPADAADRRRSTAATRARPPPTTRRRSTAASRSRRAPKHWSMHAYGEAIDVNTVENPYIAERPRDRRRTRRRTPTARTSGRGMAVEGGVLVRAFARVGWGWGGRWSRLARLPALLDERPLAHGASAGCGCRRRRSTPPAADEQPR